MRVPRKNQQTLVNAWNRQHAIGTPVMIPNSDGTYTKTTTAGPATLQGGYIAVIQLKGLLGFHRLSAVESDYLT